jgi:uncharacterized protein
MGRRLSALRWLTAIALLLAAVVAAAAPAAWMARHPDEPGELLLLGSIHVLRAENHPLPPLIDALVDAADRVVFELDLTDMGAVQAQLTAAAALPAGQSLVSRLGPALYATATERAAQHGVALTILDRYQPWFVAVSLTAIGMQNLGYRSEYGVEQHVRSRALAESKALLGLESVTDQIGVFSRLTEQQQSLLLRQALDELDRGADTMDELVAAWEQGELDELRAGLLVEFDDFPGLYSQLIVERNVAWAERLQRLVRDDRRYLVVVGALHLVGEDSLIELLRRRGFEIAPVR